MAELGGYHVIAADNRGHGLSGKEKPWNWRQFGEDLTALIAHLGLRDIVGAGHSMGGVCMIQAAASEPERFRRLVLLDPVVFEPAAYHDRPDWAGDEHPVSRRRKAWDSPQQMYDAFCAREPYSRWHAGVLMDYCRYGLVQSGDSLELACPPAIEEAVYITSLDYDIHDRIPRVGVDVTVVRARYVNVFEAARDFSLSPTWPGLAERFVSGTDVYLPDETHFMPMEKPELAAKIIVGES